MGANVTLAGTGTLIGQTTATHTSNGKVVNIKVTFQGGATHTLADVWNISGTLSLGSSITTTTVNGNSINASGSFNAGVGTNVLGTTQLNLTGTGTWTSTGSGGLRLSVNINTSGTITMSGNIRYNTGTFTYTTGTVIATGSTLTFATAAPTININGAGLTLGTVNPQVSMSFGGTSGFSMQTFTCTTAGLTITWKSGLTYTITTSITVTGTIVAPSSVSFVASTGGSQAFINLLDGAAQDIAFCNATDIGRTAGQKIYARNGTLSNTTWIALVPSVLKRGYASTF